MEPRKSLKNQSGPLVGEITIDEVNETLWDAIRDQKKGDVEYGPFGKKCPIFSFEHVSHTTSKEQTAHQWWSLRHGL
jgi:hypothetical protein